MRPVGDEVGSFSPIDGERFVEIVAPAIGFVGIGEVVRAAHYEGCALPDKKRGDADGRDAMAFDDVRGSSCGEDDEEWVDRQDVSNAHVQRTRHGYG